MKLDIIIPTIEKDLPILPLCVEAAKKYIPHEIEHIYIVGPHSDKIINRCNRMGVDFINEKDYLGFTKNDLNIRKDRQGWVYQQLIKLNGLLGGNENYIVLDSDKVLLKEHKFIYDEDKKPIFYMLNGGCTYTDNLYSLMNFPRINEHSFITDKMIFNKYVINEIHYALEQVHKVKWIDAIVNSYNNSSFHGFSEFEFYGNFYTNILGYPCETVINNEITFNKIVYSVEDCEQMFPDATAVAFHSLLINNDKLPDHQ